MSMDECSCSNPSLVHHIAGGKANFATHFNTDLQSKYIQGLHAYNEAKEKHPGPYKNKLEMITPKTFLYESTLAEDVHPKYSFDQILYGCFYSAAFMHLLSATAFCSWYPEQFPDKEQPTDDEKALYKLLHNVYNGTSLDQTILQINTRLVILMKACGEPINELITYQYFNNYPIAPIYSEMGTITKDVHAEYNSREGSKTLNDISTNISFMGQETERNRYADSYKDRIYLYKLNEYSNDLNKRIEDMVSKNKAFEHIKGLLFKYPLTTKFNPRQFIETKGGTPMKVIKSMKEALGLDLKHIYINSEFDEQLDPLTGGDETDNSLNISSKSNSNDNSNQANASSSKPSKRKLKYYASIVNPTMKKINVQIQAKIDKAKNLTTKQLRALQDPITIIEKNFQNKYVSVFSFTSKPGHTTCASNQNGVILPIEPTYEYHYLFPNDTFNSGYIARRDFLNNISEFGVYLEKLTSLYDKLKQLYEERNKEMIEALGESTFKSKRSPSNYNENKENVNNVDETGLIGRTEVKLVEKKDEDLLNLLSELYQWLENDFFKAFYDEMDKTYAQCQQCQSSRYRRHAIGYIKLLIKNENEPRTIEYYKDKLNGIIGVRTNLRNYIKIGLRGPDINIRRQFTNRMIYLFGMHNDDAKLNHYFIPCTVTILSIARSSVNFTDMNEVDRYAIIRRDGEDPNYIDFISQGQRIRMIHYTRLLKESNEVNMIVDDSIQTLKTLSERSYEQENVPQSPSQSGGHEQKRNIIILMCILAVVILIIVIVIISSYRKLLNIIRRVHNSSD